MSSFHPHSSTWYVYILVLSKLTQIHFNGTNFINARLTQRLFSVWPVAQPLVGEMEMQCCQLSNIADPFSNFFPFKKSIQTLFSIWESPVLPREVLLSQHVHTSLCLSLSLSLSLRLLKFLFSAQRRGAALYFS